MKRYRECIRKVSNCEVCSLSNYGQDCQGNPINPIAYYRKKNNLTWKKLAEESGLSINTIAKLESGERAIAKLALGNAIAMAKALKLKRVEDLLPQSEEE